MGGLSTWWWNDDGILKEYGDFSPNQPSAKVTVGMCSQRYYVK